MQGNVDTTFETLQHDLFRSGMAARIGADALAVWLAIKAHADFNTGVSWPGMRKLAKLTGMGLGTAHKSVHALLESKLLRLIDAGKKTNRYVARERLEVKICDQVLCTVVVDYVPARIRQQLQQLQQNLKTGEQAPDFWAACEIIPGQGFFWDSAAGVLRASIPVPAWAPPLPEENQNELQQRVLAIRKKLLERSRQ